VDQFEDILSLDIFRKPIEISEVSGPKTTGFRYLKIIFTSLTEILVFILTLLGISRPK